MDAKHQLKYTYTGTDLEEHSPVEVTFEIPGEATLTQMLNNFECYLKACGFYFDGHLEFVDSESNWDKDILDDSEEYFNGNSFPQSMADTGASTDVSVNNCYGLKVTSSPCETSEDSKWTKADKMLKEWNEGIARLDNEQKQKCREEALKMSGLYEAALKEVAKNNWVHGICNPKAK